MAPGVIETLQEQAATLRSVANELDRIARSKPGHDLSKELSVVVRNIRVLARFLDVAVRFAEMKQEHEQAAKASAAGAH